MRSLCAITPGVRPSACSLIVKPDRSCRVRAWPGLLTVGGGKSNEARASRGPARPKPLRMQHYVRKRTNEEIRRRGIGICSGYILGRPERPDFPQLEAPSQSGTLLLELVDQRCRNGIPAGNVLHLLLRVLSG